MELFTISQLQQFSGIKAHTIRIWEQRYNALLPSRSEGNTRYYESNQLRRLLNIVSLLDEGFKISELGCMPDEKLYNLVETKVIAKTIKDDSNEYYIAQLIAASTSFDQMHFDKIFSNCLLRIGMRNTYTQVIYPTLIRMGLMWAANSLSAAFEHFCSQLIIQKMHAAVDALPPAKPDTSKWLLFLPENEFHEIGLLFSNYLLRLTGRKVIYLGSNVPLNALQNAVYHTHPDNLLLFFVHNDTTSDTQDYLNNLKLKFPNTEIYVSGNEKLINKLLVTEGFHWIRSVEDFETELLESQFTFKP